MNDNLGHIVERTFFDRDQLSLLRTLFDASFREAKDSNGRDANIVEFSAEQVVISEVLSGAVMKAENYIAENFQANGVSLAKVWMVKSKATDTDASKLPFLPHFDKHRYLKAMIYLHDVSRDHGPIHFGSLRSPAAIESRRRILPSNYKELGLNTVEAKDLRSDLRPILGTAGDAIFFDTNAPHCAGIVSEGFERNVIRFDFDVRGLNSSKPFFERLSHFVFRRIG